MNTTRDPRRAGSGDRPDPAASGRRPLLAVERALVAAGVALLGLAGAARLAGEAGRSSALGAFDEAARVASERLGAAGVDTSLWSEERIRAFEESLGRELGAPLAVLAVPKIRLEVPVLEGTDDLTLNRAVGHIEGTARPGEAGNVGIAGHRDGFFRGLKDVAVGDALVLTTLASSRAYAVESIRIVTPEDVWVLDPTPSPSVTLVTCYPFYFVGSAPYRYIVRAVERGSSLPSPRSSPDPARPQPGRKKGANP